VRGCTNVCGSCGVVTVDAASVLLCVGLGNWVVVATLSIVSSMGQGEGRRDCVMWACSVVRRGDTVPLFLWRVSVLGTGGEVFRG